MTVIRHKKLERLLQLAYSAERAAALAYIGHANSISEPGKKLEIKKIENDEWEHRQTILKILNQYNMPVSRINELKYLIIGRVIGFNCHVIGKFMPYYFAGRLESGNVCEYVRAKEYFHEIGISEHDSELDHMAYTEKEHEIYFYNQVKNSKSLPFFSYIFGWGLNQETRENGIDHCVERKVAS